MLLAVIREFLYVVKGLVLGRGPAGSAKLIRCVPFPTTGEIIAHQAIRIGVILHQDLCAVVQLRNTAGRQQPGDTRPEFPVILPQDRKSGVWGKNWYVLLD